ncbi:hypothetical protein Pth03_19220 [Planotetraspora thailandica]|uniref:Polysaccharide chain length determinant N-terminal domain-containing protein n=1 Tax=Planotetraspora thailandica TaxID=487172 RepID=A0A8J3UX49_9ACTN|nr:hypothetical protein [Planotetraspora thailandica]GII53533.1 hypothetical protein Pth03_19220 [Planotetraspora thailandica]
MDLLDSLRALLRRWPVTLTMFIVTVAATVGGLFAIPWQYESNATVVFLSSRKSSEPVGGNPWLAFDSSLTITAEVISRGMSDERTTEMLKQEGNTADYTVGLAQDSQGPLLQITSTAPNPKIAQSTMDRLASLSQSRLTDMQRKSAIVPDATIRAELVTSTDMAELTPEKKIRMLVIIFAGGMLLTLGVPLFLESLAQKRRRAGQTDQTDQTAAVRPGHPSPAVSSYPSRSSRPAGGALARSSGPSRGRPSARKPIEAPEPRGYEEGYTAPLPVIKAHEDLYVWSDDEKDRARDASSSRSGDGAGRKGKPEDQVRRQSETERPSSGGGPEDEPTVIFDPTRPGR